MSRGVTSLSDARANVAMMRYAQGDQLAFRELYALLAPRVLRLCEHFSPGEAEDLCQDTFAKIHAARATYSDKANVAQWAFTIARRTYFDRVRYRRRRPEGAMPEHTLSNTRAARDTCPEALLITKRMRRDHERQLAGLSGTLRHAYERVCIQEQSCSEAAAQLGTSHTAVKQRVHRARQQLADALLPWAC